jgi:hypothetical protein
MEKERKEKERKQSLHWRREYRQLKVVLILAEPAGLVPTTARF